MQQVSAERILVPAKLETQYNPTPDDWQLLKRVLVRLIDDDATGIIHQIVRTMTLIEMNQDNATVLLELLSGGADS